MTDETRSCAEWRALMPDGLAGALSEDESCALERHLDACGDCADEMRSLEAVWNDLGDLPAAENRPDARSVLMDRIRAELEAGAGASGASGAAGPTHAASGTVRRYDTSRRSGSSRVKAPSHPDSTAQRIRLVRWLSRAAVILFVFAGGYVVGRAGGGSGDDATGVTAAGGASYLLLLHENESYEGPPAEEAVAEYAQWAGDVASSGRLVGAEKLTDEFGVWLRGPDAGRIETGVRGAAGGAELSAEAVAGRATGFFIITAPGEAAAVDIAATNPHLKYGGVVQIREIEDIGD